MMIPPPSAGDPFQAAAALARGPRSSSAHADASPPDAADPAVVVTLSKPSDAPATYNASGKMSSAPSLEDMGADAPDSLADASESDRGDDTAPDATTAAAANASGASVDANEEATAAA